VAEDRDPEPLRLAQLPHQRALALLREVKPAGERNAATVKTLLTRVTSLLDDLK